MDVSVDRFANRLPLYGAARGSFQYPMAFFSGVSEKKPGGPKSSAIVWNKQRKRLTPNSVSRSDNLSTFVYCKFLQSKGNFSSVHSIKQRGMGVYLRTSALREEPRTWMEAGRQSSVTPGRYGKIFSLATARRRGEPDVGGCPRGIGRGNQRHLGGPFHRIKFAPQQKAQSSGATRRCSYTSESCKSTALWRRVQSLDQVPTKFSRQDCIAEVEKTK